MLSQKEQKHFVFSLFNEDEVEEGEFNSLQDAINYASYNHIEKYKIIVIGEFSKGIE